MLNPNETGTCRRLASHLADNVTDAVTWANSFTEATGARIVSYNMFKVGGKDSPDQHCYIVLFCDVPALPAAKRRA